MEIDYEEYLKPVVGKPKMGDTLLLALCGIWTITHIDKQGHIWCGGLNLKQTLDQEQRIIPEETVKKLKEVLDYKPGDFVEGLNSEGELIRGYVSDVFWTSIERPFAVLDATTGYTNLLTRESVKRSKADFAFAEWLRILKKIN